MDTWITSDWHWGHKNIVRGESEWKDLSACRNFKTLEEHNSTLIQNINKCAKWNDIVYMLGDFAFGGKQNIWKLWSQLECKNIHLILGNHDLHIRKNSIILDDDGLEIRVQSLFTSVNDVLTKNICNERITLCHYAMRTWDNGHHGAWMLYGHSHGSLADYAVNLPTTINDRNGSFIKNTTNLIKFKTMDVGVDCHPEFRPFHIDEIRKEMSNRIPLRVDHHDDMTT